MNGKDRRLLGAAALIASLAAPAAAPAQPETAGALNACAKIKTNRDRLDCYDRLARHGTPVTAENPAHGGAAAAEPRRPVRGAAGDDAVKRENAPPAKPAAKAAPAERAKRSTTAERAAFGLQRQSQTPSEISVTVSGVQRTYFGEVTFTTEDGQVWKQTGARRPRLPEPPFAATIERGSFDSYFLRPITGGAAVRVLRQR